MIWKQPMLVKDLHHIVQALRCSQKIIFAFFFQEQHLSLFPLLENLLWTEHLFFPSCTFNIKVSQNLRWFIIQCPSPPYPYVNLVHFSRVLCPDPVPAWDKPSIWWIQKALQKLDVWPEFEVTTWSLGWGTHKIGMFEGLAGLILMKLVKSFILECSTRWWKKNKNVQFLLGLMLLKSHLQEVLWYS